MKSIDEQLKIIKTLIDENANIKVKEDGFLSRGFVVDNGKLVFKFPRNKDVSYKTEIDILNFINSIDLNINLQKVAFVEPNNQYLGIYGVLGNSLEEKFLSKEEQVEAGKKLGLFLKKLHSVKTQKGIPCPLQLEIESWQKRVVDIKNFIKSTFNQDEQNVIDKLIFGYMPKKLNELGENLVFSHGDLGDGNIFIDDHGEIGVIDFNESGLLEEAADFMDIKSDIIRNAMLDSYQANEVLRQKVEIRKDIRALIVLKPYLTRNNEQIIQELISNIKQTLKKYMFLLSKS